MRARRGSRSSLRPGGVVLTESVWEDDVTLRFPVLLATLLSISAGALSGQMVAVNGASYNPSTPIAPGSFASVFGTNLCGQTMAGSWVAPGQLPLLLGGCSIQVGGVPAMMQYVSPGQINFVMPSGVAAGTANIVVASGGQTQTGSMMSGESGPGVFTNGGTGVGMGAMLLGTNFKMVPFSTTTNGQPTPVSIFLTGMDLSSTPQVSLGGVTMPVTWFGNAPGYVGLQQINVTMPSGAAGAGRAPAIVTSNGVTSNVTFMQVLPTTAMMQGMPGWGSSMMIGEDTMRAYEVSSMAWNATNGTALVTDENDDAVRVMSLASNTVLATITLPSGSEAHEIAVNAAGTMAAASLSALNSVALIDLTKNQVSSVAGTGTYPSGMAFAGTALLVANGGSGTVSVIDSTTGLVARTVNVGFGPSGIAAAGNTAVAANTQDGSVSLIDLTSYQVTTVPLSTESRPREVAISTAANKAVITNPFERAVTLVDLTSHATTEVDLGAASGMGPGAIAVNGSTAYVTEQMSAAVAVVDLTSGAVTKTFAVDPGPVALAVDPANNRLMVLSEGTGVLDAVDLSSYSITSRMSGTSTARTGTFLMPLIASITPASAAPGASFTLTINGSGLQSVTGMDFGLESGSFGGMGGGMMGGGGGSSGGADPNIQVSNFQAQSSGTQITATVTISSAATPGVRVIRLETSYGMIAGMMNRAQFTVNP